MGSIGACSYGRWLNELVNTLNSLAVDTKQTLLDTETEVEQALEPAQLLQGCREYPTVTRFGHARRD